MDWGKGYLQYVVSIVLLCSFLFPEMTNVPFDYLFNLLFSKTKEN